MIPEEGVDVDMPTDYVSPMLATSTSDVSNPTASFESSTRCRTESPYRTIQDHG
jgi:hypothetical protein